VTYCLRERFSTVTDCFIYLLVDVDADARKLSKREPADDDVDDNSYATSSGTKGTSCGAILPSHLPFRPQRNYREDSRSTASSTHPHGTMTSQMEGVFSTYQQTRQPGSLRRAALLATVGSKLPCPEDIPSMELAATSAAVRGVGSSFQIDISPHCQYLSTYSSPLSAFGAGSASSDPLYYPHRSTVNPMPLHGTCRNIGSEEHWIRGTLDQRSIGSEEDWIRGALDQRSIGSEEHCIAEVIFRFRQHKRNNY